MATIHNEDEPAEDLDSDFWGDEPEFDEPLPLTENPTAHVIGDESAQNEMELAAFRQMLVDLEEDGLHENRTAELNKALAEIRSVGFANIQDFFEVDEGTGVVRLMPITSLPRQVAAGIKKIKIRREVAQRVQHGRFIDGMGNEVEDQVDAEFVTMKSEIIEIELWDKMNALEKLMRHYGAYSEDNKQKEGTGGQVLDLLFGSIGAKGLPAPGSNNSG